MLMGAAFLQTDLGPGQQLAITHGSKDDGICNHGNRTTRCASVALIQRSAAKVATVIVALGVHVAKDQVRAHWLRPFVLTQPHAIFSQEDAFAKHCSNMQSFAQAIGLHPCAKKVIHKRKNRHVDGLNILALRNMLHI